MFPSHWSKRLWRILILALMGVLVATCKSKPKIEDPPPEAAEIGVADETILVSTGASSEPSFSADGKEMLFVSARRPAHAGRQVYIRDMATGTERRVTFQNGSTTHPRFYPKGGAILYASSTDEEKENPPLLNLDLPPKPSKLPEFYTQTYEIYLHQLGDGLNIRRLTGHAGFDGEARFTNDGKAITFTRIDKEHAQILSQALDANAHGGVRPKSLAGLGENPTAYVTSPDGLATAWIEWDQTWGVSRLRLRRGKDTIDVAPDMIVTKSDAEFTPDSKYLLWAQKDPQTGLNEIWSFELKDNCLQHFVFRSEGDRRDPIVTPDMKSLTYTLQSRGRSRIAQVPFLQRTGPCPVIP